VLSLAHALGFDYDTMIASYPMLGMRPMRDRLDLTPDQQVALDQLREQTAARRRAAPGQPLDNNDGAAIEAILTPEQRAQLDEANFRRQILLALNYPEKRAEVGVTAEQLAAWQALADEARTRLHAVDQKMLADVLQIVTPKQREQLTALIAQDTAP
jgi:Spy/CpxP family protein refolding chaperone